MRRLGNAGGLAWLHCSFSAHIQRGVQLCVILVEDVQHKHLHTGQHERSCMLQSVGAHAGQAKSSGSSTHARLASQISTCRQCTHGGLLQATATMRPKAPKQDMPWVGRRTHLQRIRGYQAVVRPKQPALVVAPRLELLVTGGKSGGRRGVIAEQVGRDKAVPPPSSGKQLLSKMRQACYKRDLSRHPHHAPAPPPALHCLLSPAGWSA